MGATLVRHHVAPRPQCPVCGRKSLRDPDRARMLTRTTLRGIATDMANLLNDPRRLS